MDKEERTNKVLIPKSICHRFSLHKWIWKGRNRSFLAGTCRRCGMQGGDFWARQREEMKKAKKVEKKT